MTDIKDWHASDLKYANNVRHAQINLDIVSDGSHQTEDFLFYKHNGRCRIYNRVCDHNGGRLFIKDGKAVCPLHGWELDLSSGDYLTAKFHKQPVLTVDDNELDSPLVDIPVDDERLELNNFTREYHVDISFFNHACLYFEVSTGLKFATDPWVVGSAFNNGWWLARPSPADVFEKLNGCDFIYVSHNHPDHLHPESLSHIRKDMPILTADFESGSTTEILEREGFTNIVAMNLTTQLRHPSDDISLAVLKSGDFRDDSGLLVELGAFKCLLTVDSNFLNFGKLPDKVDLVASAFAGGATGFPLCFETYSEEQKKILVRRNRNVIKAMNKNTIERVSTRYFMPYAGFFTEAADRDAYIKVRNAKNSLDEYQSMCDSADVTLLNVDAADRFQFRGSELIAQEKSCVKRWEDFPVDYYLSKTKTEAPVLTDSEIITYFVASAFKDSLVMKIDLTTDDFASANRSFIVDFSGDDGVSVRGAPADTRPLAEADHLPNRHLHIKAREHEFYDVLSKGKPWEDLSIGFQCRVHRTPNIYNSDFWFHFTNTYIGRRTRLR